METHVHSLNTLFKQLGLESSDAAIDAFIENNKPLPVDIELHNAQIWNTSQSAFLKQVKEDDADWAEIVDQLDVMLR
jgi:hypothetical protein